MTETKGRNVGLVIAGAILFVAAALNLFTGFRTLSDKSNLAQQLEVTNAALNHYAWSAFAFGIIEAVAAVLLLQRRREGAAVTYTVVVMAAVYWLADLAVRPGIAIVALVALAAVTALTVMNRADFE